MLEMPTTPQQEQQQQQNYSPPPISVTNMADSTFSPQQNYIADANDLTFLVQQIKELHESNKNLENKLLGVTSELVDMKKTGLNDKQLTVLGGWHTFSPQQELAISVWKSASNAEGQCSRNILVEANSKFVQLLGYSMDVLKNNFACTNMIRKQDICPDGRDGKNARDWPKRTQIITAFGLKDVFITITPVQEGKNLPPKYFLVYMLEVSP